ncbi:MAG: hypothetical protein AAFQ44_07285, partial [Pseudomonadota bacterium]
MWRQATPGAHAAMAGHRRADGMQSLGQEVITEFRREAASVLIESWNSPPSLRLERGKWLQRLKLKLVA